MRSGVPKNLPCVAFPFYSEEGIPVWHDLIKDFEPMTEILFESPTNWQPSFILQELLACQKG